MLPNAVNAIMFFFENTVEHVASLLCTEGQHIGERYLQFMTAYNDLTSVYEFYCLARLFRSNSCRVSVLPSAHLTVTPPSYYQPS